MGAYLGSRGKHILFRAMVYIIHKKDRLGHGKQDSLNGELGEKTFKIKEYWL